MERPTFEEIKDIATAAIRRVIGDTYADIEAQADQDWLGREVYIFTLRFSSEAAWQVASDRAVRLMTAIIDALSERGDVRFPHVRLLSDGSWTLTQDAAAE